MYEKRRRKRKHLTPNERGLIEQLCKLGLSQTQIAKQLQVSQPTICRELKRGKVQQLNGQTWEYYYTYSAQTAQDNATYNKTAHGPDLKIKNDWDYLKALERHIMTGSSPADAIQKEKGKHQTDISKTTCYRYIQMGIFPNVKYVHLPQGHPKKRKGKVSHASNISHPLHRSIEKRELTISTRQELGHWELDSVIGKSKGKKESCLVMSERKTRAEIILKVESKTADATAKALTRLRKEIGRDWKTLVKTITCDNGTEFADQKSIDALGVTTFYCHPSAPSERGTNEVTNKLVRRKLPKGQSMKKVTQKQATEVQHWVNDYTRPMFGGKSAKQVLEEELETMDLQNPEKVKRFFNIE